MDCLFYILYNFSQFRDSSIRPRKVYRDYYYIITILIGFLLLYFSYYSLQIKINEKKIKEIEDKIIEKEELLNTMKDIVILKKISRIK